MEKPERGTLEAAKTYDARRFQSPRMRKLNAQEQAFAWSVFWRLGPKAEVLDVPCGNGRFFGIFYPAKRIHMIDMAPTMIQAILERFPDAAKHQPRQGDIMNLDLPDGSVDIAFCMRLFHHFKEASQRQRALAELARVSRRFVAISYYDKASWRYLKKVLRGKKPSGNAVAFRVLQEEAAALGLRVVERVPSFAFIEQQRCVLFEKG